MCEMCPAGAPAVIGMHWIAGSFALTNRIPLFGKDTPRELSQLSESRGFAPVLWLEPADEDQPQNLTPEPPALL